MKRTSLTTITAVCLFAVYRVYAGWIAGVVAMEVPPPAPPEVGTAPIQPRLFTTVSETALPDDEWTRTATYTYQRADNVFLFAQQVEILEEGVGNRVQFSPFALVCRDTNDPAREPLVITSHTARIQFEQPFKLDLGASSPGRIIAAALEGPVRISGPDGLLIGGQDFVFSEEARHLYSEWPVQFSFGPPDRERSRDGEASEVQGSAEGLQMDLLPGFEGAMGRRDLPRIAGIERIRLRRNVRMRLTQARDGKTRTAHVTCNGSFEYNVAERIATFEDDVLVECPTSPPDATPQQADRLQCTWLALLFEEAPEEESTPADAALAGAAATGGVVPASASSGDREFVHPFGNLRFQRLRARGERDVRAALQSEENDLIANMQELHYDARTRVVALLDNDAVLVQQGALKLACPEIALVHDEQDRGGGMQSLFCRGKGDLTQRDDRGRELKAFWTEQLRIDPDPATGLTLIQADGSAKVIQPGQVGIVADHLLAWVDGDLGGRTLEAGTRKSEAGESGVRGQGSGVGRKSSDGNQPPDAALRYALAEGHVTMSGPEFHLETNRLRATFEERVPAASRPDPAAGATTGPPGTGVNQAGMSGDAAGPPWIVTAQDIQVRVLQDANAGSPRASGGRSPPRSEVAEVIGEGNVEIVRPAATGPAGEEDPALSVTGNRLHLVNQGGAGQVLTLTGAPAHLRRGEMHLEGGHIRFDGARNRADVIGDGMLQFPVTSDLNGNALDQPALLDILWRRQMTFDGLRAAFVEGVQLRLDDSRLYCEEMEVELDRRLSFAEQPPDQEQVQVRRVQCKDGVRLETYKWEGTKLVGVRRAQLAEFRLDYATGDFTGQGPGTVNSWAWGAQRSVAIAPRAAAQANQPAASDKLPWEYNHVQFARGGEMTGNIRQKVVELRGQVRAIYAPVEHALETFDRDELSGDSPSASSAVWLGCDTLSVTLHPWRDRKGDYAMFGADGHCELEGQLFRAVSDTISYDQSKELFTLRGLGDRTASIYYQKEPGLSQSRVAGQSIQFVPSQRRVMVQGSPGIQAVQ